MGLRARAWHPDAALVWRRRLGPRLDARQQAESPGAPAAAAKEHLLEERRCERRRGAADLEHHGNFLNRSLPTASSSHFLTLILRRVPTSGSFPSTGTGSRGPSGARPSGSTGRDSRRTAPGSRTFPTSPEGWRSMSRPIQAREDRCKFRRAAGWRLTGRRAVTSCSIGTKTR